MDDCAKNLKKLMRVYGYTAAALTQKIKDMGHGFNQTSIKLLLDPVVPDSKGGMKAFDPRRSTEQRVAEAFNIERYQLISPDGFDDNGRPNGTKGKISKEDVYKASIMVLKTYAEIADDTKFLDRINLHFFGETCKEVAAAFSESDRAAEITQIKQFQSMPPIPR